MPTMKFDKRSIDRLPHTASGQVDYFDTDTPGLGLRVGATTKTFFVKVDVPDSTSKSGYKTVRRSLGRYGELTLEQAKKELDGYDDREKGFVPGKRLELKRGDVTAKGDKVTLRELLAAYFSERTSRKSGKSLKQSTVDYYTKKLERNFSTWLDLKLPVIAKLSPDMLIEKHRQIKADNGVYEARNAVVILKAVIGYGCLKYPAVLPFNPLAALTHPDAKILAPIKAREEALKGEDFQTFYQGIRGFNQILTDCYQFILYTGLRHMEAAPLRWNQVDLDNKTLFIPDTKNRRDFLAPLSRQAVEILKGRKEKSTKDNPFVFPPVRADYSKAGHARLQAMALRDRTGLKITVHGLRRTFITVGRRLKLYHDVDRLTNHVDGSVSGKHYDQTDIEDLRQPLQVICNEIERLMKEGTAAKVVNLNG